MLTKENIAQVGQREEKTIPQPETQYVTPNNLLPLSEVRKPVWTVNINSGLGRGMEKTSYTRSTPDL